MAGGRISIWESIGIPEMDGGDGSTTLQMCLMSLNWTLKNGGNGQCHVVNILQ